MLYSCTHMATVGVKGLTTRRPTRYVQIAKLDVHYLARNQPVTMFSRRGKTFTFCAVKF